MSALYDYASAVWAAARYGFRGRRWRQTPAAVSPLPAPPMTSFNCGPHRPAAMRPIRLQGAHPEKTPGHCGQTPCRCQPDGDAA